MPEWIKVSDRLPDDDETVQLFVPKASEPIWPGYMDAGAWRWIEGSPVTSAVTHWQPFPEPPSDSAEQTEE